ncbi:hypothetical protein AB1283_26085 [Bacillus sp. S13(2024)]|uniref:hypothetical protein n=1 Tax=Bacillus sp. S13(2024) TaxID=3162885 RepID=UPI003D1F232A
MTDEIIGKVYKNNAGQEYKVIHIAGTVRNGVKKYRIRFLKTGYERDIEKVEIKRGKIKDRYAPSVFGIGIIGNYNVKDYKREYSLWSGMLERCYDTNSTGYSSYGAKGVTVCDRWHHFENFLHDLSLVDRFNYEEFYGGNLYLDKDLKQQSTPLGERVYSLHTCTFLTFEENNELANHEHRKIEFIAVDTKGNAIRHKGVKEFCRNNEGFHRQRIMDCLKKKALTHKGWRFFYPNDYREDVI